MLSTTFDRFFIIFNEEFRANKKIAFEVIMFLAFAHFFGYYNPKQLADYLGIAHQQLYQSLKGWSLYHLKKMLSKFMVHQAAELLRPVLAKSAATRSRAGLSISIDNSVIDRLGNLLRCTWSWYSGRFKKVVNGQDLLGVTLTINGLVIPIGLLFCSKQGRANTDKPSLLIAMMTTLVDAFKAEGIDLTTLPITMDSWFASDDLNKKLAQLGFTTNIVAGKGNYTFKINRKKQKASLWKKVLCLQTGQWGIDVPSLRVNAESPTFGEIVLFCYQKSTTSNCYLMDFSETPLRGAEIWHIWKQHFQIEAFWKILKSILKIKEMRLQGDGIYTGLLIKVFADLFVIQHKMKSEFSNSTITQIRRKIRHHFELKEHMVEHFHLPTWLTKEIMVC